MTKARGICNDCSGTVKRGHQCLTLVERFWSRVNKTETCWLWMGAHTGKTRPYGVIRLGTGSNQLTHRFSYEIHCGPIPEGLFVLHHCDNPPCVNPDHLFLGTKKDNAADMVNKGRTTSPFTVADVRLIRSRHALGVKPTTISKEYNLPLSTVWDIVSRNTWKHI